MEKPNDYVWLVESRSKVQHVLLDIYTFLKDNPELQQREFERSVFGLLIGAAFSLWRAVFLTSADRSWPSILEAAEDMLKLVLEDNAITFQQDKRTRNWMAGYYLNNARDRLVRVRSKFVEVMDADRLAQIPQLDYVQSSGGITETDAAIVWDKTYEALRAAFELIKQR